MVEADAGEGLDDLRTVYEKLKCRWGDHKLFQAEEWIIPDGWRLSVNGREKDFIYRCHQCSISIICSVPLNDLLLDYDPGGLYRKQAS